MDLPQVSVSAAKSSIPEDTAALLQSDRADHGNRGLLQLLEQKSSVYLRNYGPAHSSGISVRGTAPVHTQLVWRDLPLNHSMLGMSDLSLISGPILQQARLREGGPCQAAVSDNFGGIIFLGNSLPGKNSLLAGSSAGSFGNLQNWFSASAKRNRLSAQINAWYHAADNNFPFLKEGEWKTTQHARRKSAGTESQLGLQISDRWKWSGALWLQQTDRQIPAALYQGRSEAVQLDKSLRTSQNLEYEKNNTRIKGGYGFSSEFLRFVDPVAELHSESTVKQHFAWLNWDQKWKKIRLYTRAWANRASAETRNYSRTAVLTRLALQQGLEIELSPRLALALSNRSERYRYAPSAREGLAFQPSATLSFVHPLAGRLSSGFHRKMRLPGLNDLFWNPGGNPNLKPEKGWNAELHWEKSLLNHGAFVWQAETKGYLSEIDDYILWLPRGWMWSPKNTGPVSIRGLEAGNSLEWKQGKLSIRLKNQVHFCQSQNSRPRFEGDAAAGKQMPYVPVFQAGNQLEVRYKSTLVLLWHQFTGSRAADVAGIQNLPAFHLLNIRAETGMAAGKHCRILFFAECRNMAAAQYQMMPGFPMPDRQFQAGIQTEFH